MGREIRITYLKGAVKFLKKNPQLLTESDVDKLVIRFVRKRFFAEEVNVDYKQLSGELKEYYRIRKGAVRIIVRVVDETIIIEAIVENIGFRGDIYKM